jgi:hypothetical protein
MTLLLLFISGRRPGESMEGMESAAAIGSPNVKKGGSLNREQSARSTDGVLQRRPPMGGVVKGKNDP